MIKPVFGTVVADSHRNRFSSLSFELEIWFESAEVCQKKVLIDAIHFVC